MLNRQLLTMGDDEFFSDQNQLNINNIIRVSIIVRVSIFIKVFFFSFYFKLISNINFIPFTFSI